MAERGRDLLAQDGVVVLDATFRHNADRTVAREMALKPGAQWRVIECRLTPQLVRERLERRAALKEGLSDATLQTYVRQRPEFEPFDDRDSPRLELDTGADLALVAHRATEVCLIQAGKIPHVLRESTQQLIRSRTKSSIQGVGTLVA